MPVSLEAPLLGDFAGGTNTRTQLSSTCCFRILKVLFSHIVCKLQLFSRTL